MSNNNRSLRSLAITGSLWTLTGYGASQVLRLSSHLVLAWLLAPRIFGLMALVSVVQQGLAMFSDIGIGPSIIQSKRGDDPDFLKTAWTIQIIRGVVLWFCACILAWPVAALFAKNDPAAWQLMYLLPVAGFGAVLSGFNSTALMTLNRKLNLGRITLLELTTQIWALGVIVIWALLSPTVWAMVGGGLAGAAFKMVASHFVVKGPHLRIAWCRACVDELIRFGRWVFLSTVFTYLSRNLDKFVLGNVLTLDHLGLYSIASVFAQVAQIVSLRLSNTVLFPVYAKLRDNQEQMSSAILRSREIILWVGLSVCISISVCAPIFFSTFWDVRYHQAGSIAQWVVLYIWTTIVLLTIDGVPLAMGNSRALFIANVIQCTGVLIAAGGYKMAEMPGFIIGLSLGPVFAHLYLLRHMPGNSKMLLRQSIKFTIIAAVYVALALKIMALIKREDIFWDWSLAIMLSAIPLMISALMVWKLIRDDNKLGTSTMKNGKSFEAVL